MKAGKFEATTFGGEPVDPNRDFLEKLVEKSVLDGLFAELAAGGKNFPPDSPRGLLEKNTRASLELAIKANPRWAEPHFKLAAFETTPELKVKELKAAATLDPRNASYWQALAQAQEAANLYEESVKSWSLAEHAAADEPGTSQDSHRQNGFGCRSRGLHGSREKAREPKKRRATWNV